MHSFILQDWTTIRSGGTLTTTTVTQAEREWLDLEPYQDVVFWAQVAEASALVDFSFHPCPHERETDG